MEWVKIMRGWQVRLPPLDRLAGVTVHEDASLGAFGLFFLSFSFGGRTYKANYRGTAMA